MLWTIAWHPGFFSFYTEVISIQISIHGAGREVGRSAFLIDDKILLDYGIKPSDPPEYPQGDVRPEVVVVSHGHLDHCGVVPNLMDLEPKVIATPPTKQLTRLLAEDTMEIAESSHALVPFDPADMRQLLRLTREMEYLDAYEHDNHTITLFDAGHIPGSSLVYVENGKQSLLYTGDIKNTDTRLLRGSKIHYPEADALMIESTYFGKDHPDRQKLEEKFIESIRYTLDIGGNVVIPSFAIGRTQEILLILKEHRIPSYVDGMGREVTDIFLKEPEYLRDPGRLRSAYGYSTTVKGSMRKSLMDEPCVVVTTAGMLNGGPVLTYLKKIYDNPKNKVILTGYQVENTNGRTALNTGTMDLDGEIVKLRCQLEQYSFSAHSGESELKAIVKHMVDRGTTDVFCVHGDRTEEFAAWIRQEYDVNAYAPKIGDEYLI
ncbi:MBL fold metallo-hydrolase [Methanocella arvoryzae]|uniref:mRNA 3-end processing factor n=1 Tax=Methanocella arvoryzae (strain DSM 22066 / NBRC 105507 / MRE50) TaxID=351160 RepID=Q0W8H2_METAR|nr:MBL fold metallo-hydrolase [Methanocella arvoryzae]CAJ35321.1 mRNA 3-end processing factor [Methanocella arvoryzae MRE50]